MECALCVLLCERVSVWCKRKYDVGVLDSLTLPLLLYFSKKCDSFFFIVMYMPNQNSHGKVVSCYKFIMLNVQS